MQILYQLLPLVLLFAVIYFLMIRPQRKKDKQIQDMRKSLQVGDEIVTIGGICGKIVKTKDESFIIQVGADKVKFEMMRWAVSSVTKASPRRDTVDEVKENLGLPIYNRFDSIIRFDELSNEAKKKIAELEIKRLKTDFNIEDNKLFEKLKEAAITASNAREIKHLVKDTFSLLAIRKICSDAEE